MQQLARTVLRNSTAALAAQGVVKLLSFGFNVMVIRLLGASTFGQYAAVTSFGSLFLIVADLGLAPYMVREVARRRDSPDSAAAIREIFGNILAMRLLLGLLSGILVVSAALLTGRPGVMVIAIALNALSVLIYAAQGSCDAMVQGYERFDLTAGIRVIHQLIFVGLGVIALWVGMGYFGLIGAAIIGVAVNATLCWRAVRSLGVRPGPPTVTTWLALLRAAFPFGVIGLTLGLSYRFDSVLLNIYWDDTTTGHYNAAYNLILALVTLSNILNTALYPSLARYAATAPGALTQVYERTLRYLLLVAAPIAVGGWILAAPLVELLYGAEYAPSAALLSVLIWVLPLMFCSEFLGYVVVIAGREARVARAIMVSTSVNVLANLLLIPRFGAPAAAAITVITEAVLLCQYLWLLHDQLSQMRWQTLLLRPLVAVMAMATCVELAGGLPVLLTVALGGMLYTALLLIMRVVGPGEIAFVRRLLSRGARVTSDVT